MRLIEKILIGYTAFALASTVTGVVAYSNIQQDKKQIEEDTYKIVQDNGYELANAEHKQAQIEQIIQDYNNGLILIDDLSERTKKENLTELDVDLFAKNNLSDEDYEQYQELKKQAKEKNGEEFIVYGLIPLLIELLICCTSLFISKYKAQKERILNEM